MISVYQRSGHEVLKSVILFIVGGIYHVEQEYKGKMPDMQDGY